MKESITFITLRSTPVSDKKSILNAFSKEYGRVSFVVAGGRSPEAVRRRALLMPLNIVEGIADRRAGNELMTLTQPHAVSPAGSFSGNPVKNAVALFLTEVLSLLLRESQPDPDLFDYLSLSIGRLAVASTREAANFHICFLLHLSRIIGIEPDWESYRPRTVFDMSDGRFRRPDALGGTLLTIPESEAAHKLSRMTFNNMTLFRMSHNDRNTVIDMIIRYYSMHYASLSSLRSLDVLRELFI